MTCNMTEVRMTEYNPKYPFAKPQFVDKLKALFPQK